MKIPFGRPLIGSDEADAVKLVLESGQLVHGKYIRDFEEDFAEFTGAPEAIGVSSCTAGLHMAWLALGIGPGDEVLVSSQTHVASAHSISLVGAKPVFVDSEQTTGNLDLKLLEGLVSERTKAILVVHYLGTPVNMDIVGDFANSHGLRVVEDCALALGAKYDEQHVGTFGDFGAFSFYPVKHITSGEGGMVLASNPEHARKIRALRAFGYQAKDDDSRAKGLYDVDQLGMNYRMSEIHAAIGGIQLSKLPEFLKAREANYDRYASNFRTLEGLGWSFLDQPRDGTFQSSHYAFVASFSLLPSISQGVLRDRLSERGIGTSVYYPHPVPLLAYYREPQTKVENYPVASAISYKSIALPLGPHVTEGDVDFICGALRDLSNTADMGK